MPEKSDKKPLSRRDFLKSVGSSYVAINLSPKIWEAGWDSLGAKQLREDIEKLEKHFLNRYGIPIHGKKFDASRASHAPLIEEKNFEVKDLQQQSLYLTYKGLEYLRQTLAMYPPDVITNNVGEIRLAYDIRSKKDYSQASGVDSPGGFAIPWEQKIVIKSADGFPSAEEALLGTLLDSATVHHEIAHCLFRDIKSDDWEALHPGVQYTGTSFSEAKMTGGYARKYGTSNYVEDIATVAEILFPKISLAENATQKLVDLITSTPDVENPTLQRKIQFLKTEYEKKSPLMNAAYWDQLQKGNVDESYWNKPTS